MTKYSIETLCVQAGYKPKNGEPRILPIYQSTTYQYDSADHVGDLFDLKQEGHMYSRISNPTLSVLEEKVATLENGVGALSTSSGQSANLIAILTIAKQGDNIIAFNNIYGGSFNLLNSTLRDLGIETRFVKFDASDEEIAALIDENTKLIFGESLSNPKVEVLDIERIANVAHKHFIPLIIDNTFPTPVLLRPFEFGADIVTHSTTKYLDGHATSVGGMIVDSGQFDWRKGNFPSLINKDPNYHGISYTENFKEQAYITRARVVFLRDLGSTMSPQNAFLTNLGIETLALRMEKHSQNALEVAKYLNKHKDVEWVNYPLLESNKGYDLAQKYLKDGGSGIISFGVKGGVEEGKKFIDSLKLASLVVHVGDIRTHV
ncbi:MAG TPA: O-acetylhomoserine aminocarboxypropyltransferase/cysteine synthase family protein, partial [Erysipelothrix sp.]|nr:O-acetylhomoserine aminocarboxypropyltransferase/cysteine synthase family protein [Erysipelothrix sp.]